MENCLITKLKSVVANDNLSKIGELRFKITGNHLLKIGTTEYPVETQLSILDTYPDVVFTENNQRTINVDHLQRSRTTSADCEIAIKDKYKIASFSVDGNSSVECNLDDFYWCPLTEFQIYSGIDGSTGKIVGHLSKVPATVTTFSLYSKSIIVDEFPNLPQLTGINVVVSEPIDINTIVNKCPSLERLYAFYANVKGSIETLPIRTGVTLLRFEKRGSTSNNVTGNIASLGSWTGLTTLNISDTKITGSIADFLDAMYDSGAGRTSGSITITVNSLVTNVSGSGTTQTYNFSASGWAKA